jgi:hypothetical protein
MEVENAHIAALQRRCRRGEVDSFLHAGEGCGWCARPVRIQGEQYAIDTHGRETVVFSTRSLPDGVVLKACGNRRETRCPSCALVYRQDARHLVKAGLEGGKGVDPSVAEHPAVLLTLTAPSFGRVHSARPGRGPCHPGPAHGRCAHGRSLVCFGRHDMGDDVVGTPLCGPCYDYESQVLFNATVPELWRRTSVYLPRVVAKLLGLVQSECAARYRVSFARVAEFQRRGAIHLHVVVRLDRRDGEVPVVDPQVLALASTMAAGAVYVSHGDRSFHWGQEVNAEIIDRRDGTRAGRIGAYVAKYAVKSSTNNGTLDDRILSEADLVARRLSVHERRLATAAWELGARAAFGHLRLRRNAHCFGYGGHFLAKSRCYSTTLGALRRARAEFRAAQAPAQPAAAGAVAYQSRLRAVGGGWATVDEARLAELLRQVPRAGPAAWWSTS